jgi:heat shock protein HtpX
MWEAIRANRRKSALLIVVLASVLLFLGYAIGGSFDPKSGGVFGVLIAMGVWVVLVLVAVAGGEKILLATTGAHEVTHDTAPQVFNIVEEMKIASGLPAMPRVYIIDSNVPNAFAVGLNPKRAAVAVTTGLLARLDRDELQGVIAHEIGHISNRDTLFMTLAGVTMGAIIILADFYLRGMRFGMGRSRSSSKGGGQAAAIMFVIAIVFAIVAPILAQMLYFACSRKREYLADASGAQFTRYPEGLASALEKISSYQGEGLKVSKAVAPMFTVNPLAAAGSGSSIFSTHPPSQDRIRILRGMGKGSSLAAYEEAFRETHKNRSVIGARNLTSSVENGIRGPTAASAKVDPQKQWRNAQDLLQKVGQYATIACACGLNIKLPPAFDQKIVVCPRCGASHQVPLAALTAGAAVLQTGMNKPVKPVRK